MPLMMMLPERRRTMLPPELDELGPSDVALFLDLDGTLIDLAEHPAAIIVPRTLPALLAKAAKACDGALAVVSGRPIAALEQLLAPARLRAGGTHGAEMKRQPEGPCESISPCGLPPTAWLGLERLLGGFPSCFAENKRASFAIHYPERYADELRLAAALGDFMAEWVPLDLELVQGRRVFELKTRDFDKGKVIDRFMRELPFRGRIPIFIADDKLDWPGFMAVLAHGGFALAVGSPMPGLSGAFADPAAVRRWLASFCRQKAKGRSIRACFRSALFAS
jgi:trehalose 6-phosphate phosphatase